MQVFLSVGTCGEESISLAPDSSQGAIEQEREDVVTGPSRIWEWSGAVGVASCMRASTVDIARAADRFHTARRG